MNKEELIKAISQKRRINTVVLEMAYDEIFAAIVEAVANGEVVEVPGFGRFCRLKNYFGPDRLFFGPDSHFRDAVSLRKEQ